MYKQILDLLLKQDPPKYSDSDFKHPFATLGVKTKKELVVQFCKKYPWAISLDFLRDNHLDIISPISSPHIEESMIKGLGHHLYNQLQISLPSDKYYPTNYWERLAFLLVKSDDTRFLEIMYAHGFKFTDGVIIQLLNMSPLETFTKTVILSKIKNDRDEMIRALIF